MICTAPRLMSAPSKRRSSFSATSRSRPTTHASVEENLSGFKFYTASQVAVVEPRHAENGILHPRVRGICQRAK